MTLTVGLGLPEGTTSRDLWRGIRAFAAGDSAALPLTPEVRAAQLAAQKALGEKLVPSSPTPAKTGPIKAGETTAYQDCVDRSVVGDKIEGHELWQHAIRKANGLATNRLSTLASQNNPVVALDRATHVQANAAQRAFYAVGCQRYRCEWSGWRGNSSAIVPDGKTVCAN